MENNQKLNKLIDQYFEQEDRMSPTSATGLGIHKFDHQLEDFSENRIRDMKNILREEERDFAGIDYPGLDDEHRIKYHLLKERINSSRRFLDKTRQFEKDPAFYAEIAVQSLFLLMLRDFAPLEERLESAISRMKQFPDFFKAARKNIENPSKIFVRIAEELLYGANAFLTGLLPKMASKAPSVENRALLARDVALGAIRDYQRYVSEELARNASGDFACGRDLLDEMLTESEFLDYTSDQLWDMGHAELEKCENEVMEFVRKHFDNNRPWREVFKEVKKNHPPLEKLIPSYVEYLERAKAFVERNHIVDIPADQKLIAMETPEFNRALTPHVAMMPPATFEEDQTSYLWVTLPAPGLPANAIERQLRDSSYGKIQYVSLHEAYPGHHLQLVYANKVRDPIFKRTFSNIFIEGWAFYCEHMMKELGYFDREGELCQLEAAYWRALRVILDVGLHTKRFDFDEAMEFLKARVDWSPFVAEGELKRYTRMPTQALSYYTGKMEIFRIRENYRKLKSQDYSLKQFHNDLITQGSLPPKAIEWKLGLREIDDPIKN